LREELRAELREIFNQRDAIAVYATTEPLEALMMGGRTVVVHEGRVRQVGPTAEVFKNPASETVGSIFSDPPMNLIDVMVSGGVVAVADDLRFPATGHLAALPEGRFRLGVRSPHLHLRRSGPDQVAIDGTIDLAEINGSETFVHVAHHGVSWVAQELGVHTLALGAPVTVYLDPHHVFACDAAGTLVASPAHAVPAAG
jgi:glycerol transport system ATP-binding protein